MRPVSILVATHKTYRFPDDPGYFPIHVGKEGADIDLGIQGDNSGNNISGKNAHYCELTAFYWAWQNLDTDYLGLVHYRRHFKGNPHQGDNRLCGKWIASSASLKNYLEDYKVDIILPKKRNYLIESIESHYNNAHFEDDLNIIKGIIDSDFPEYKQSLERVLSSRSASMFNMFFTRKPLADQYACWLFDLLTRAEDEIELCGRTLFQQRVYGFLSEILLNVWVDHHKLVVRYLPVVHLEGENLPIKALRLIQRKLDKGRKYDA